MKAAFQFFLVISVFFLSIEVNAQALTYEIPFSEQVQRATHIIEGRVVSKQSFWNASNANIYTVNVIEVYKTFKGSATETIEIVTPGGAVGSNVEMVTPSLDLRIDDIGILCLTPSEVILNRPMESPPLFAPYGSVQSFYKYNLYDDLVANTYSKTIGITQNFYDVIINLTGTPYQTIRTFDVDEVIAQNQSNMAMAITSISPTTITAGTGSQLTINGSGFGATQGAVSFANADDGGSTTISTLDSQIVSWSDTQVIVEVPSKAGTGFARVLPAAGGVFTSPELLTITYAQINFTSTFGTGGVPTEYQTQHFDQNGNGGMTWQMQTDFDANTNAKASFLRAFDTWVCETGVNWENGTPTIVDAAALDGVNVIRFDNGPELPPGVLGRNTTYAAACSTPLPVVQVDFYVNELDIVFDDGTNWQFGPANPTGGQFDFETTAVHELGHGHQLAHVIDLSAIMHFATSGGANRILSQNDIDGGNDVQLRSVNSPVCGNGAMTNSTCSLGTDDFSLASTIQIYPLPAKNTLYIESISDIILSRLDLIDVNGRLVLSKDLAQNRNLHEINLDVVQSGIYFLKLKSNANQILTRKIVIE